MPHAHIPPLSKNNPTVRILKMHSVENIILVVPQNPPEYDWTPEKIRQLCDFRTGLGADQVMICSTDQAMTIWNADGSLALACGNGTRCVIGAMNPKIQEKITLHGPIGPLYGWKIDTQTVAIAQGPVIFPDLSQNPTQNPTQKNSPAHPHAHVTTANSPGRHKDAKESTDTETGTSFFIQNLDITLKGIPAVVGNPHAIIFRAPPEGLDPMWHPRNADFPDGINVSFVWPKKHTQTHPKSPDPTEQYFWVKTWERGIGLSKGCGSAACAIGATLHHRGGTGTTDWTQDAIPPETNKKTHAGAERNNHGNTDQPDTIYVLNMPGGVMRVWPHVSGWIHSASYHTIAECFWTP